MLLRCGVVRSMLRNEGRAWSPPESPSPRAWLWDLSKILEPLQLAKFCYFCHPFPDGSVGKESACNAGGTGDAGLIPGLGRLLRGGKWQPTPVFLPENPMDRGAGQATSPKSCRESDMTEQLSSVA